MNQQLGDQGAHHSLLRKQERSTHLRTRHAAEVIQMLIVLSAVEDFSLSITDLVNASTAAIAAG